MISVLLIWSSHITHSCAASSSHASFHHCLLSPSPHIIGKPSSTFILLIPLSDLCHSFTDHTQQLHQKIPVSCMQEAIPCIPGVTLVCTVCVWPGLQPHATSLLPSDQGHCLPTAPYHTFRDLTSTSIKTVFKGFPASFPADQGISCTVLISGDQSTDQE